MVERRSPQLWRDGPTEPPGHERCTAPADGVSRTPSRSVRATPPRRGSARGEPAPAGVAALAADGDTTRIDPPAYASLSYPVRLSPYDELYDAVETGASGGQATGFWMSLTGFARLRGVAAMRRARKRALPFARLPWAQVRLFGLVLPAAVPLAVMGLGVMAAGVWTGRAWAPSSASSVMGSASAVLAPPVAEELGDTARAALGDLEAIQRVERQPLAERTSEAVLAPHVGRVTRERQALAELGEALGARSQRTLHGAVREQLDVALSDPRLVAEALAALTRLTGPEGPDLIYEISQDAARSGEVRRLAAGLLITVDVAPRASRALRAVTELERATGCREIAVALHDATIHADARAAAVVRRWTMTDPCEPSEGADCPACRAALSGLADLAAALRERPYVPQLARSPVWAAAPIVTFRELPTAASESRQELLALAPPGSRPASRGAIGGRRPARAAVSSPVSSPSAEPSVAGSPAGVASAPATSRPTTDPGF